MAIGGEAMELITLPEGTVTTTNLLDGSIDLVISQLWDDVAGVAIQSGLDSCVINEEVLIGTTEDISSTCTQGYAGITVVVYFNESFNKDDCDACNVDELSELGGDSEFCAYRIEIPCETMEVECGEPSAAPSGSYYPSSAPTDSPTVSVSPTNSPTATPTAAPTNSPTDSPTSKPTDPPTVSPTSKPTDPPTVSPTISPTTKERIIDCPDNEAILVAKEGEFMYDDIPIIINMQNGTHVSFQVDNTFGSTVSSVFTQYHSGSFGETECLEEENADADPIDFTAQCMRNTKISIVNIWITECEQSEFSFLNDNVDNAEIPECCHSGLECNTVQYTFKLPCVDACPDDRLEPRSDPVRKLAHEMIREKKAHEGSTSEFEEITGQPEPNDIEDHFCVIEDYPCGVENDKVHVCHYSARDGYKTFCVPEGDSDALRFYPKDYCGPCVGGYATA